MRTPGDGRQQGVTARRCQRRIETGRNKKETQKQITQGPGEESAIVYPKEEYE